MQENAQENIYKLVTNTVHEQVRIILQELNITEEIEINRINCNIPKNEAHGDIATNAAMIIAHKIKKNPVEIANYLAQKLNEIDYIKSTEVAKPAFINMVIEDHMWQNIVNIVNTKKLEFGKSDLGQGKKINVEFVSANPTGPLHLGNARGAVIGDVLSRILTKTGYQVTKEYYINDAGKQIDELSQSVYLRYLENLGQKIDDSSISYPGEYISEIAQDLIKQYSDKLIQAPNRDQIIAEYSVNSITQTIKRDLGNLNVNFDIFTKESDIHKSGKVQEALEVLKKHNVLYEGILPKPKGKLLQDWEPRNQILFKSTEYGDDVDRPLQKSDNSWTYFASDVAYHFDKIQRGFYHMILEIGKDHGGYKKRMQAAVSALSGGNAKIDVIFHDIVNLYNNNVAIKMSKRSGQFLTLHDTLQMVDKDSLRIIMLFCKNEMVINFDIQKTKEQSKDNIVFYIQYAYARANSVINKAKEYIEIPENFKIQNSILSSSEELSMMKVLAYFPCLIEEIALNYEPHKLVFYLYKVASQFHALWHSGKDNELKKFIFMDNIELTKARISLVQAIKCVVHCGLDILNITPLERM